MTYSANTTPHFTLYMDGIGKVGTDPGGFFARDFVMQPDATDTNQVLRIGGRDEAGGYTTFIGMMDDVQFYNAALATNDIAFLFNNPGQVILPPLVPVITQQPQQTQTVAEGATVTLSATAEARNPLNYQWSLNGDALPGATSATLTLTNVTKAQAGTYTLVASNSDGKATSDPAVLYVVGAGGQSELSLNLYAGITIIGLVGGTNRIEYVNVLGDTNDWKALATIVLPSSPYLWFDIQSTNFQRRFYRTILLP